jgi:hypothetical protein
MLRHVQLLGVFWRVWGALWVLVAASLLILAGGAAAPFFDPAEDRTIAFAASVTAGFFAAAGGFALIWGGAHLWAGSRLGRGDPHARLLSLGLAVVNLLVLPFGTGLGAYALWVLLRDETRRIFEPPPVSEYVSR